MSDDPLLFEIQDRVAVITLNRPAQRNAINQDMGTKLMDRLAEVRADPEIRVAILTGAGGTFSAGADLKERASGGGQRSQDNAPASVIEANPDARWSTMTFEKPLIAAIDGYCLAGGMELALAADIRVCSTGAQFGLPEITHGFFPGGGGPQRLARSIPQSMAMELVLTGDRIDAETALRVGIVSRMVPADDLMPTALKIATRIAGHAPARGQGREGNHPNGVGRNLRAGHAARRRPPLDCRTNRGREGRPPRLRREAPPELYGPLTAGPAVPSVPLPLILIEQVFHEIGGGHDTDQCAAVVYHRQRVKRSRAQFLRCRADRFTGADRDEVARHHLLYRELRIQILRIGGIRRSIGIKAELHHVAGTDHADRLLAVNDRHVVYAIFGQ